MDLSQALQMVSRSDAGMVRSHNEDAVFTNVACGLAILADGMGGYNAGEVASGMATNLLGTEIEKELRKTEPYKLDVSGKLHSHAVLEAEIAKANTAIYQAAQSQPQYAGMGTTLVVALFYDNMMTVAHIGDSRLYRLRGGEFQAITRDHSLLQEQIDAGLITPEQAAFSINRNLVTRAVGVEDTVLLETHEHDVSSGDLYLLCSDGLSDMLDEATMLQLLQTNDSLPSMGNALIEAANEAGGKDNISLVLVRTTGNPGNPHRAWWPFKR